MTPANQNPQSSIRSLPKSLRICIYVAVGGMLVIGAIGNMASTVLATTFPGSYRALSDATPSLQALHARLEAGTSSDGAAPATVMAQAVTELYGVAVWGVACILGVAVCACMVAPRVTFPNQPGTERIRVLGLGIFLLALAGAMIFFGLYPFRSEAILVRGGILLSSPLWWLRTIMLTGACTIGVMIVTWALVVILKSKRDSSVQ